MQTEAEAGAVCSRFAGSAFPAFPFSIPNDFVKERITKMANNENNRGGLGMVACVAILVGGMIGSAIFSLSGMTMYYAGPAAVLSWIIAAVIMGMYGMQVAELATIYPKSGGIFVFPARALGKNEEQGSVWGFISAWGFMISNSIAVAFSAIYVATYLGAGFSFFGDAEGSHTKQIIFAIIAVAFCMALNLLKITDAGKFNNILVGGLVVTLLIYVFAVFGSGAWNPAQYVPFFTQGAKGGSGFITAIPVAMVGYGACVAIAFMVSEVKNPNRTVPKSLIIALIIVVILYLLVIVSTLGVVTAGFLNENAGFRFIPLYAAAFTTLAGITWLPKLISVAAFLALITTILVVLAQNARTVAAMAEAGLLPKGLAKESKNGVPAVATVVLSIIAAILCCFPSITEFLVNMGALFAAISIVITCLSLIEARKKTTRLEGAYHAPGGAIMPIITMVLIVLCYVPDILTGGWQLWVFTIACYVVGLIVMAIMKNVNKTSTSAK